MQTVILCGGLGTRLSEETILKPKPMVEVGDHPILWHIMKHYGHYDFKEFFLALGYKGDVIKKYFLDYHSLNGDITVDLATGKVKVHESEREDWIIHLVDTGLTVNTGGRIKRLEPLLSKQTFMVTYGDGVCDLNLNDLLSFHRSHGRTATVTAVRPPARFGSFIFDGNFVAEFTEKPQIGEGWINGGYIVLEPEIFDYLDGDTSSLESDALERLALDGQLAAYRHGQFWQCMDTLRDKHRLETLWSEGQA